MMDRTTTKGSFSLQGLPGNPLPRNTSEHVANQAKLMNNNNSNASNIGATKNPPLTRHRSSVSFTDNSLSKRPSVPSLQRVPSVPRDRTLVSVDFGKDDMTKSTLERSLDDKGFSRSTNLSALYGTMLVLVGLVVPMTEALRDDWLSNHVIAAFVTYLYSCASLFVVYSVTHEIILKKQHDREEREEREVTVGHISDSYTPNKVIPDDCVFVNYAIDEKDEEPVAGTSDGDSSADTQPSDSDNLQEQIDGTPKVDFFVGQSKLAAGEPAQKSWSPRRRSSSMTSQSSHDPDDVYNYFAMHMGTATLVDEGTSYFVKGGLLVFAMANIVYVALRIEGEHMRIRECGEEIIVYPHYVHMLFIVMQTFFLLKECKFVFRRHKPLVRFGFAHLIATNLCVWLRFLMMEVVETLAHSDHAEDHSTIGASNTSDMNETGCDVTPISSVASHYLFPFVLEYSLVAMSICAFLLSSINIRVSRELYKAVYKALSQRKLAHRANDPQNESSDASAGSNEHHSFFSKSHTGLYLGVLVLAGTVIAMIMFFYYNGVEDFKKANLCYTISETVSLSLLMAATITGMVRFAKYVFDVNHSNGFDHALLLLSVSFYVVLELFEMFADVWYIMEGNDEPEDIMHLITCIVAIIQCTMQTVYILDGMQRVAVKEEHHRHKYGRGVITFLIIANVAAWVFSSFLEKQADTVAPQLFYGEVAWAIIESVALPLVLFFRFHSSICLAHMWHHCYESHDDSVMDNKLLL